MKHHTYVFRSSTDAEIAVEVWPDGIDVKVRPDPSAVWGLPLERVQEEGDPVQFAFDEEAPDVYDEEYDELDISLPSSWSSTAQLDAEDRARGGSLP